MDQIFCGVTLATCYSLLLQTFSRDPSYQHFCLAHLFTHIGFDNGVLGLAYIAGPRPYSVGGICSPCKWIWITVILISESFSTTTTFPRICSWVMFTVSVANFLFPTSCAFSVLLLLLLSSLLLCIFLFLFFFQLFYTPVVKFLGVEKLLLLIFDFVSTGFQCCSVCEALYPYKWKFGDCRRWHYTHWIFILVT